MAIALCWQGNQHAGAAAQAPAAPGQAAPSQEETKDTLQTPTEPQRPSSSQVERGGLLAGKGRLELEYRLSYAHFSRNVIFIDGVAILPVLVVGEIAVERIRRDILVASVTGRYGLRDNLQLELTVPYRYQGDRSSVPEATPPRETTLSDRGLGDIQAGLFYQLPGSSARPIKYIAGLRVKSTTGKDIFEINPEKEHAMGTGFWNTKLSLTAVRVSDPAVLFATVGYTHNFDRRNLLVTSQDPETGEPVQTRVSFYPGGTIELGTGLAYALNPRLSLNTQFAVSWTRATRVQTPTSGGSVPISGTTLTVGSLRLGTVWVDDPRAATELSAEIGLTEDAPDMLLELRRSYRF